MATYQSTQTVAEIVSATPALAVVFEKFGIDYCCHGKQPLQAACAAANVDLQVILTELAAAQPGPSGGEPDWNMATLEALVLNILNTHHALLRTELPRLESMLAKVVRVHGHHHPELAEVAAVFNDLSAELGSHMMKEEQILFPAIVQLERHQNGGRGPWIANPIRVMEHEHAAVGTMLAAIKKDTGNYTPPADACNTYRVLFDSLRRLEADLHTHIHKENNILFPRAQALEQELAGAAAR